jgi:hypothetical protein
MESKRISLIINESCREMQAFESARSCVSAVIYLQLISLFSYLFPPLPLGEEG